jgi:nitrite reductase/ring-hydroxylating ferredoxin subunit
MVWKAAVDLAQLQQQKRKTLLIDGQKILLIWHKAQVHATQAHCPHFKLPLTKGKITDECAIICPFHKSAFDLTTGDVQCWSPWPPAIGHLLGKVIKPKNLKIYATRIEQGKIEVDVV